MDLEPASKWEAFSHQFSSIAGAGPVTGWKEAAFGVVLITLALFLKVTGRKDWMLYVPMGFMLLVTITALATSVYAICMKLFVTGGFQVMTGGLQLVFAVLQMALGLMVSMRSGKKLVEKAAENLDTNQDSPAAASR